LRNLFPFRVVLYFPLFSDRSLASKHNPRTAASARVRKAIGKSGDEGIDGMIKEDKLGLDSIYIQAKRWEGMVGRTQIQNFVGALQVKKSKKGIFITTSRFSKGAEEYARNVPTKIVLIDGEQLAQLMIDNDIGVTKEATYEIQKK